MTVFEFITFLLKHNMYIRQNGSTQGLDEFISEVLCKELVSEDIVESLFITVEDAAVIHKVGIETMKAIISGLNIGVYSINGKDMIPRCYVEKIEKG